MIKIKEGNILNATEDIIGHQVNCRGVMGGGLAKQIRDKYPHVYSLYKGECKRGDRDILMGSNLVIDIDGGKYVANLFGQDGYGRGKQQTEYWALRKALKKLENFASKNNYTVALPYGLGCGLAGGDWDVVYQMIEETIKEVDVVLYKYNG